MDAWPTFATDVLGAAFAEQGQNGALRLKVDDAPWRIEIAPAEADKFSFAGWTVDDAGDPDALTSPLRAAGIKVHEGDDA